MPASGFVYALAVYAFFLASFAYAVGFVADVPLLPWTIDGAGDVPLAEAVGVDLALLALFAFQHSVMARRGFKRWWTRVVPPAVERATYVLAASLALDLLMWQWRPIVQPVLWSLQTHWSCVAVQAVFWAGWALLLISTFLIDHFALFGLAQSWRAFRGKGSNAPDDLRTPLFYRRVRHPIYLGFLLAFWATPHMTAGHALFAAGCTGYILLGIWFEERDLVAQFGSRYLAYRQQAGMLWPKWRRGIRS